MTYVAKRPPRQKQQEALDRMAERPAHWRHFYALLMAMRTGKSKVVLDDFGQLHASGEVDDLAVVAPAGVYRTWLTAIEDDVGESIASSLGIYVFSAQEGQSEAARKRLSTFLEHSGPRVLLMNVEALSSVRRAQDLLMRFASQRRCYGAVDESTIIKNPSSKRTKFCLKQIAPRLKHRRILSGLLAPQSPLDVFSQFQFLEPGCLGFSSYWTFRSRYAILSPKFIGGRRIEVVDGFRDVEDLSERMAPHSFRVRLEDCYDLPPKIYAVREVPLTEEQQRIYRDMRDYATSRLSGEAHVTATMAMTQMMRLHQVLCGHVRDESGELHSIPQNRTRELLELLEEHEGKAIVWCAYDQDIQEVVRALSDEHGPQSVARFWGGNLKTREDEERRFKEDPACQFMVATAAAGGRGRTWTIADLVVYYSSDTNLEHREQSEERPQGVGKLTSVLYVDLVAVAPWGDGKTVDHKHLRALREKINLAGTITGDAWREWVV